MSETEWQQLKGELITFGKSVGSHGFAAGFDFRGGIPSEIIATFPDEWLAEYQGKNYVAYDPVVIWGAQNDGVRTWDELEKLFPSPRVDVISAARRHGIRNGSVVSLTVNRKKTVIGITHAADRLAKGEIFTLIGLLANMSIVAPSVAPPYELTDRGVNYLRLAAQGLTDQEIASHQGVTPRAVSSLRERVLRKLGAPTLSSGLLAAFKSRIVD